MRQPAVLLAAVLLGLGATVPAVAVVTAGPDDAVEAVIDRRMPSSGVPGLAYAVVADGQITAAGARGVVRAGGGEVVGPDTPFPTGSISKSVTALAVMQLVEAGEVALDTGVSEYLDDFSGRASGAITVRQLLSHTSGFSTLQGNASHTDVTGGRDELAHRVTGLAEVVPAHAPDERWEYSNANYLVLGRLVEVVSGEEYQDYVASNILRPVGMDDSFVSDGEVHEGVATGHRPWFGTKRPLAGQPDRPRDGSGRWVGRQRDRPGALPAGDDERRGRRAERRGQGPHDAPGRRGLPVLRPRLVRGRRQRQRVALRLGPRGRVARHPGSLGRQGGGRAGQRGQRRRVRGDGRAAWAASSPRRSASTRLKGLAGSQRALFVALVLLPVGYLLSMVWAWRHRAGIRAKSGLAGLFSLWFPLLTTGVAAWVMLGVVPALLGAPLGTLRLFQPDLGLVLVAGAVTGVLWAVVRLVVAYTGGGRRG